MRQDSSISSSASAAVSFRPPPCPPLTAAQRAHVASLDRAVDRLFHSLFLCADNEENGRRPGDGSKQEEATTMRNGASSVFANWMERLAPFIADRPLTALRLVGTHNSASYGIGSSNNNTNSSSRRTEQKRRRGGGHADAYASTTNGSYSSFSCCSPFREAATVGPDAPAILQGLPCGLRECVHAAVAAPWAQTEALSVGEQLRAGIRYIDMRVSPRITPLLPQQRQKEQKGKNNTTHRTSLFGTPKMAAARMKQGTERSNDDFGDDVDDDEDILWCSHGLYSVPHAAVMADVLQFARAHPKEVFILDYNRVVGCTDDTRIVVRDTGESNGNNVTGHYTVTTPLRALLRDWGSLIDADVLISSDPIDIGTATLRQLWALPGAPTVLLTVCDDIANFLSRPLQDLPPPPPLSCSTTTNNYSPSHASHISNGIISISGGLVTPRLKALHHFAAMCGGRRRRDDVLDSAWHNQPTASALLAACGTYAAQHRAHVVNNNGTTDHSATITMNHVNPPRLFVTGAVVTPGTATVVGGLPRLLCCGPCVASPSVARCCVRPVGAAVAQPLSSNKSGLRSVLNGAASVAPPRVAPMMGEVDDRGDNATAPAAATAATIGGRPSSADHLISRHDGTDVATGSGHVEAYEKDLCVEEEEEHLLDPDAACLRAACGRSLFHSSRDVNPSALAAFRGLSRPFSRERWEHLWRAVTAAVPPPSSNACHYPPEVYAQLEATVRDHWGQRCGSGGGKESSGSSHHHHHHDHHHRCLWCASNADTNILQLDFACDALVVIQRFTANNNAPLQRQWSEGAVEMAIRLNLLQFAV